MIGAPLMMARSKPPSTLTNGLVGGWHLNGNGADVLGLNPGTPINTPVFDAGLNGEQALRTYGWDPSGAGAYQIHTFPSTVLRPRNKISAAMWLYFEEYPAGNTRIFSDYDQSTLSTRWILGYTNGAGLYTVMYHPSFADALVPIEALVLIPLKTWFHVAFTWDGTMIYTYYNGVAKSSYARGGLLQEGAANPLSIGTQFNAGKANNGMMQYCYIYNRDLQPSEVAELATPGTRWPFN